MLILLILVVLILVAALPRWPYSRNWGHMPSIGLGVIAALLALLLSIWAFHMFVPAMIGVLISEALALRSWMYHAANGGISAWLGWALTRDIQEEYRFLTEPGILIAAGLLGGLVYWLVAGWTAGFWKPTSRTK